jgi:hypothetical protein
MAKLFKKGQVSAKKAYQIADSLKNVSYTDHSISREYKKEGNDKASAEWYRSAISAHQKSDRIKQAADNAVNKAKGRDIPLPPSDKLF